jgi:hypothetical protein
MTNKYEVPVAPLEFTFSLTYLLLLYIYNSVYFCIHVRPTTWASSGAVSRRLLSSHCPRLPAVWSLGGRQRVCTL